MLIAVLAGLVVLALVVGSHWYLWRRMVRDTTSPRTALRRAGTAVVVLGPVLAVATERSGAPFLLVRVLSWPGYLWLVLFLYAFLALLAAELVRPVTAAAVAVGTVGYGLADVLTGPRVLHVTVPLRKLPPSADGFRIAVVSDIHLAPPSAAASPSGWSTP